MKLLKRTKTGKNELIEKFSALGDKTRFRLFEILLQKKDICVSELAEEIHISNAGVSQQLKIMEQAGIVTRRRNGQKICYVVNYSEPANKQLLEMLGN